VPQHDAAAVQPANANNGVVTLDDIQPLLQPIIDDLFHGPLALLQAQMQTQSSSAAAQGSKHSHAGSFTT
jgi:hypothetical protein